MSPLEMLHVARFANLMKAIGRVSSRTTIFSRRPIDEQGMVDERKVFYSRRVRSHSLPFSGDLARGWSTAGRSFVVGGDDAADGGDAA